MHIFKQDCKAAFCSWGFWLAVATYLGIIVFESWNDFQIIATPDALYLYHIVDFASFLSLVAPLLAAIPYGLRFVQECNDQYVRPVLLRISVRKYCLSKIGACFIAGGSAIAGAVLIFFIIYGKLGVLATAETIENLSQVNSLGPILLVPQCGLYLFLFFLLLGKFLYGGFSALFCLAISAFTENGYIALCAPFAFVRIWLYFTSWLPNSYLFDIDSLSRFDVLKPEWGPLNSLCYVVCAYLFLSLVCSIVFIKGARRRLQNV